MVDYNKLIKRRIEKIKELKDIGVNPYFNEFQTNAFAGDIVEKYGLMNEDKLKDVKEIFKIAGRVVAYRSFGKAGFIKLKDFTGKIQVYAEKNSLSEVDFKVYKKLDVGDIIGAEGYLFKTKTGELTLHAKKIAMLTKSIRPLPEKWHGLQDKELRYRERYVDLIVNEDVQKTFIKRARIINLIREFMVKNRFIEVETPMMHKIVGGATAKPFVTHHNALDVDLYLRIAPELYLKRLVVGGMDRIFEINRNFRNEGMDLKHNPEFTMMEFYTAYKTYDFLLEFTQDMFRYVIKNLGMSDKIIKYNNMDIDFSTPWKKIGFYDALKTIGKLDESIINNKEKSLDLALSLKKSVNKDTPHEKILAELFDALVEPKLINPTFIFGYPVEISPLARRNSKNPKITDRFELFIASTEIANGFSELNDPFDQSERFKNQLEERKRGDEEASMYDEDYIRALEYGLPPTAGEGIGIDRMVMLLTDNPSIRDVILFPLMKDK